MLIAFHSYKGGTGKTLLSVNLATILANNDKKVCLLDLDFSAPSLHAIFRNIVAEYWLNDYLNKDCGIDKVLKDCCSDYVANGRMFVGLANPSSEAIQDITAKDRKWEMKALSRLLSLKTSLFEKFNFNHVILDTSPGLQYSSINAIFSADVVFVVTTLDKSDVEGTQRMIQDLYKIFDKKAKIILNKVPFDSLPVGKLKFDWLGLPIIGAIPCSCDILEAEEYFFAGKKPNHAFMRTLKEVATEIE